MRYVLDTNTLIYFFKGMGKVSQRLLSSPPEHVAIPAIVLYELEVGIAKSRNARRRREQLDEFVEVVAVLDFGKAEALAAAAIRAWLEKKGTPIGTLDILIAATAHAQSATLVTHNTQEFGRVKGLKLEDWFGSD